MHPVQARVLAEIITFIEEKVGEEPYLADCDENSAGEIEVRLGFTVRRDYPGIGTKEAGKA
jgi:hypothetical protein